MPAKLTSDYPDGQDFKRHLDAEDASQGQKTGHMRWVLGVSTALVVIGMVIAFAAFYRPTPASVAAQANHVEAPALQSDQTPASTPPSSAAPQSSPPLP